MEFRQLNTFIQVAQFQSFSKAAESLGYSQSAVTVQIKLLEEEMHTRLFDRMGKRVMLTARGEQFLDCANSILYELERTRRSMNGERELTHPLRIGTIESLCFSKLPPILRFFREHYPKVFLQIVTASPEELICLMERNELDLIYILDAPRWNADWCKAMEEQERIVFVCSPSSPLAGRTGLTLPELLTEPFFLTEKNANYRQAFDQCLAGRKLCLSPLLEVSNTEFIVRMLEQNEGLSVLPYFAVQKDIEKGRLCMLDVTDVQISMYRQIFYHKSKFRTREMEEFIRLAASSSVDSGFSRVYNKEESTDDETEDDRYE
ncbi:MAG: LysR family transcriptional regulator [Eubacteriales bacterium]|nr:LysR family transcriptional regulator [Eubacteriales bacterium]